MLLFIPKWHSRLARLEICTIVQRFNYINKGLPKIWMKFRVISLAVKGFK